MAFLYVATLLGVLAAVGVFTSVWSVMPQPPTNADLVEGRNPSMDIQPYSPWRFS